VSVHCTVLMLHLRVFDDGIVVADKAIDELSAPYRYHVVVHVFDNGGCRLEGMQPGDGGGRFKRSDSYDMEQALKPHGIRWAEYRHKHKDIKRVFR